MRLDDSLISGASAMEIDSVLVIGSGTMGRGIAQAAATCGLKTYLHDAAAGQLRSASAEIDKSVGKLAEKGKITAEQAGSARKNLVICEGLEAVGWADLGLAVEAI